MTDLNPVKVGMRFTTPLGKDKRMMRVSWVHSQGYVIFKAVDAPEGSEYHYLSITTMQNKQIVRVDPEWLEEREAIESGDYEPATPEEREELDGLGSSNG